MAGLYDVVFLDVRLPDGNGLKAIPGIQGAPAVPEVIIITGKGDPDGAELAIRSGAWDYIRKPFSPQQVILPLSRALQYRVEKAVDQPAFLLDRKSIIGNSPKMVRSLELLARAARSETSVLITGETGTGKELFAKAIHENSKRKSAPFVIVDCGALPDTLVESTLFGHRKGAFTGAEKNRSGLIEQADGGTLLLDEVGELPLSSQKAFLRVLQDHRFRPVGSQREIGSDFRLIAATNRDLDHLVETGRFRKDLLFRLRSLTIDLPPLRGRTEDLNELILHYLSEICKAHQTGAKGFSPEFFEAMVSHTWSGNVRELVHALEWAVEAALQEPTLFPKHLPDHIRIPFARTSAGASDKKDPRSKNQEEQPKPFPALKALITETEKRYLQQLLTATEGNVKEACRISGLSRSRFYDRLKKHHISRQFKL
jgi:two-component system NtrC family response regulator